MKSCFAKENLLNNSFVKVFVGFYTKANSFFKKYYYLHNFVLAFIAVIIIEAFNRRSILSSVGFMVFDFDLFFINFMLVFSTISISIVLKKRYFWKYLIWSSWLILGIVNYIMYVVRLVPFTFNDILLIPSTITVIPVYLTLFEIILIIVFLLALLVFVIIMFVKARKISFTVKRNWIVFLTVFIISTLTYIGGQSFGCTDNRVHGLLDKLDRNGFSYCYVSSIVDRGMSKPDGYTQETINNIRVQTSDSHFKNFNNANIVFLQLESFFDPKQIKDVSYSQNPTPVFDELKKDYSHGYLSVPSFGAGTANTEFEVISGFNLDFMGIGEVAYRTEVEDETVETACHALKNHGYTTHGIHNNDATFYNRNIVFKNLGFDTFTSLEYMYNVEYNYTGWAKDKVLISSIEDCLSSTDGTDMVYAIGVQPHPVFPSEYPDEYRIVDCEGFDSIGNEDRFEYFLGQLKEDDEFLGELITYFENYNEPIVFVIFGDHLPAFQFENSMFINNNKYLTEYVLWSNFDMEKREQNLSTYQLYSYVFNRLNIDGNLLSDLHIDYKFDTSNELYFKNTEMVQYDLLDGNCYSSNNQKPNKTDASLGIRKIIVKSAEPVDEGLAIIGENFNEFSYVLINNKKYKTEYIDSEKLIVNCDKYDDITISVAQIDEMGYKLSTSNTIEV